MGDVLVQKKAPIGAMKVVVISESPSCHSTRRAGLVYREHYDVVSRAVWNFLQGSHHGGPDITPNAKLDIYSATIHDTGSCRLEVSLAEELVSL